jgi:hypothetical protein
MKKPLKIEVQVSQWFSGQAVAGLAFGDWLGMTPQAKLTARLTFIRDEADRLGAMTYQEDCPYPANLIAEARELRDRSAQALAALQLGDFDSAGLLALDVGIMMEGLNRSLAIWAALQLQRQAQRRRSAGGDTTREVRQEEQAERIAEIKRIWHSLTAENNAIRHRTIALRLGLKPDTVSRLTKKAGLR